jgi:hypothetical protein
LEIHSLKDWEVVRLVQAKQQDAERLREELPLQKQAPLAKVEQTRPQNLHGLHVPYNLRNTTIH